jgi:hypothetical protein
MVLKKPKGKKNPTREKQKNKKKKKRKNTPRPRGFFKISGYYAFLGAF